MNVTFVTQKLNLQGGGSNFSLELMARSLINRGNEVRILTLKPNLNNLPNKYQFNILEPPKQRFGTRLGRLERAYRAMKYYQNSTDLYHVFTPSLLAAAGLFRSHQTKTPVIGRLNNYTNFCVNSNLMDGECHRNCDIRSKFKHQDAGLPKRILKLPFYASRTYAEPQLSSKLDRYFAVSPAVKKIYTDIGFPPERIVVIPNFYDPNFGLEHKTTKESTEQLDVLYVGRIKRSKGIDILLRALSQVSNVSAKIIGTGEALSELRSLSTELGLRERVVFTDRIEHEELPDHYMNADIFVHPGRWPEPLNRTLLESLQCGTPAIVSDIGGPPWAIGDAGMTFPSEDYVRLAEILDELKRNRSKIRRMASKCEAQLSRFSPDKVVDEIQREYEEIINSQ